jgi:hypothetical protein
MMVINTLVSYFHQNSFIILRINDETDLKA